MTTYQTLYNQALTSIKSVCVNVSNFASLPAQYKSGYSYIQTNARSNLKWTIKNPIVAVAAATVESDFRSLMQTYGIINILGNTVTPRGLFNFYSALANFCSSRICICSSQLATGKYIVYVSKTYSAVNKLPEGSVAYASDVNMICKDINSIIGSNAKSYYITYTTSVYGS